MGSHEQSRKQLVYCVQGVYQPLLLQGWLSKPQQTPLNPATPVEQGFTPVCCLSMWSRGVPGPVKLESKSRGRARTRAFLAAGQRARRPRRAGQLVRVLGSQRASSARPRPVKPTESSLRRRRHANGGRVHDPSA
jgi:hypothetical protein